MGFRKLARLFVARNWLVLTAALLVAGAAIVWARSHNQEVRPLFEAVAPVSFVSAETRGGNAPTVVEPLNAAAEIAEEANSDAIAAGLGQVTVDERAGELRLTARDDQREQAMATATEMREAYFLAAAGGAEAARQARLDEIVAEATVLFERLDEMQPDLPVEPTLSEADQARLDFMSTQVEALEQRSFQLFGDLILAQLGDDRVGSPEEIQEELDLIETALEELRIEIEELDPTGNLSDDRQTGSGAPATDSGTARETSNGTDDPASGDVEFVWTIEAINGRLDELQLEYEELFNETGSTETVSTTPGPVRVTDITDPRLPVLLLAVAGLLAGLLIAMGIALAESRFRGRILVGADLPSSRLLAELPSWRRTLVQSGRRSKALASRLERLAARRLAAVKVLRQSVVGLVGQWGGPAIVGIGGSKVDHAEVEALALELAHSMAATDRTVLLLDLDFTSETAVIGDGSGTSVATILGRIRQNGGASTAELESAFLEGVPVAPSLRIITSGTPSEEPADLVLTSSFNLLLATAKHQAEVVLAIVPESTAPEFAAVAERLDGLVAVAQVMKTQQKDLEPAINSGRLLGWVLLTPWRQPSAAWWLPGRGLERLRKRVKSTKQPSPSIEDAATQSASVRAARHKNQRRDAIERSRSDLGSEGEPRDVGGAVATDEADDRSLD